MNRKRPTDWTLHTQERGGAGRGKGEGIIKTGKVSMDFRGNGSQTAAALNPSHKGEGEGSRRQAK